MKHDHLLQQPEWMDAKAWNRQFLVGTPVRYHPALPPGTEPYVDTVTRSRAWDLDGEDAAGRCETLVKIEGHAGGVSTRHLEVLAPHRRVIAYICELVGNIPTEGVDPEKLQAVITEIHCACMAADPTLDPDDALYQRPDADKRDVQNRDLGLLRRATMILRSVVDFQESLGDITPFVRDLVEDAEALLEDADPVLNPCSTLPEDPGGAARPDGVLLAGLKVDENRDRAEPSNEQS